MLTVTETLMSFVCEGIRLSAIKRNTNLTLLFTPFTFEIDLETKRIRRTERFHHRDYTDTENPLI